MSTSRPRSTWGVPILFALCTAVGTLSSGCDFEFDVKNVADAAAEDSTNDENDESTLREEHSTTTDTSGLGQTGPTDTESDTSDVKPAETDDTVSTTPNETETDTTDNPETEFRTETESESETESGTEPTTDTIPEPACAGVTAGGFCWYLSSSNGDCDSTCLDHGGYNEGTRAYAGSGGTNAHCNEVLFALGAPGSGSCDTELFVSGVGCAVITFESNRWVRIDWPATERFGWGIGARRACACNE